MARCKTFGYDARDRLVWARTNSVGNGPYDETYGYDRMGNILTRTVDGEEWRYAYGVQQTEVVTPPGPVGPWRVYLPLVMAPPAYPPVPARTWGQPFAVLSTTVGFRAAYDASGNMVLRVEVSGTQRITYTQEWDAENRLAVVTNTVTGQVTRFVYDGDGNRLLRIGPDGTTVYIGDYYEQTGSAIRKYYYAGGQRIAVRVDGALYFLHSDHLGSATLTTDASGNRVGEVRYKPYGEVQYSWGVMPTDRLYTGQRWDSALGLYDYRARYYDPALGRFVSADPLVPEPGNPQSLNRYAYVLNNPIRYTDPSGHWPAWLDFLLGAGYQFFNDMSWGIPNLVLGTSWQEERSAAFQSGQEIGRDMSTAVGTALAVDGATTAAVGLTSGPPTAAVVAGCAGATGGICAIPGGVVLTAEGVMVMGGAAEAAYGSSVLLYARGNPTKGPSYTARNFRRNLENRTPIPKGMQDAQAHHMLPEALEKEFSKLGINVHDPRWGAWVEGTPPGTHQNWSYRYNQAWMKWLEENPEATLEQIIAQAQRMAAEYGINWSWQP